MRIASRLATHSLQVSEGIFRSLRNLLLIHIYNTQGQENAEIQKNIQNFHSTTLEYHRAVALRNFILQGVGVVMICALTLIVKKMEALSATLLVSYFYLLMRFIQNFIEIFQSYVNIKFYTPQSKLLYNWWVDKGSHEVNEELNQVAVLSKTLTEPVGWNLKNVFFSILTRRQKNYQ
jgi:hypothetical protein